jgi:hypothetical protein
MGFLVRGVVMSDSLRNKAKDLNPATRAALEAELGRAFADDESVYVSVCPPYVEPVPEARKEAAEGLRTYFEELNRRVPAVSDEEAEAAVIEAMRSVRPGYREIE